MYACKCTIYTSMYTVVIYVENFRNLHKLVRKLPVRLCALKCWSWKAKITTADPAATSSWSVIVLMGEALSTLKYLEPRAWFPISWFIMLWTSHCTRYGSIEHTTSAGSPAAGAKQRRYFGPNKEVMPARRKLSLSAPRAKWHCPTVLLPSHVVTAVLVKQSRAWGHAERYAYEIHWNPTWLLAVHLSIIETIATIIGCNLVISPEWIYSFWLMTVCNALQAGDFIPRNMIAK